MSPFSTAASTPTLALLPKHTIGTQEPLDLYNVNMTHLKLFSNLFSKEFQTFEESGQQDIMPMAIYAKYALTTPYLCIKSLQRQP